MKLFPLYAILATVLVPVAVSAQTIYHDSFTRGTPASPVSLYGTSPDVTNLPGATWTKDGNGGNDFVTIGTSLQVSGGSDNEEGNLAFSLANLPAGASSTSGMLTLSATVTSNNAGGWVAFGFTTGTAAAYNNGVDWMLLTPDGIVQAFAGAPLNNVVSTSSTGAGSTTALLSVSLNLATDMATFSENGTSLGTFAAGSLSSISEVNITNLHPSSGSLTNFDLTYAAAAAPEPSSWALLLGGCAFTMMIVRVRRLKTQV